MKFRKRYKNNSKVNILLPLVFLFIVFLSVGYSSLNQELNITSEAVFRVEESIRITDIKLVGSAFNGIENYNSSYSKDRIKTGITLNEANSSITYQVTITNTGNVPMNLSSLENINYNNDGITYELNEKLPFMINKGEEKKIEITYKWNSYNEESKNLDSVIKFNFIKAESVLAKGSTSLFINNSSFDRSKVESIRFMPTIEVPSSAIEAWDASLNKDGSVMAYTLDNDSNNLYELYIAGYGKIKLSEADSLFYNFSNTVTINFDNLIITDNVTTMPSMFFGCSSMTEIDLSNFDTKKVTNMSAMFQRCSKLTNINISSFDTSNITNMSNMFNGCSSLEGTLDLSHFNMQNVTTIQNMLSSCKSLNILKLNDWNAEKLTNVSGMFNSDTGIVELEMNNFSAPLLENLSSFFGNTYNEQSPKLSGAITISINNWNIPKVKNLSRMFFMSNKLKTLNMEGFNAPSATDTSFMFARCGLLESIDLKDFDTSKVVSMSYMFGGDSILKEIIGLNDFNTSNVTTMSYMFSSCSKLTNINISSFDTSNITNMSNMFNGCSSLEGTLDLSHFNMQNVTTIQNMLSSCKSLNILKLNDWNAEKLTNVSGMFNSDTGIVELEMNNFSAPLLENLSSFFGNTYNEQSPKLSGAITISINNWNIPKVKNLSRMFFMSNKLKTLNMEGFNAPSATDTSFMFARCGLLESIDLKDFDLINVTNMTSMFEKCSSLKEIDFSLVNSETYEKDIFKNMINQVGDITFYVKDSDCKDLLEAIKPNATVEIKSA